MESDKKLSLIWLRSHLAVYGIKKAISIYVDLIGLAEQRKGKTTIALHMLPDSCNEGAKVTIDLVFDVTSTKIEENVQSTLPPHRASRLITKSPRSLLTKQDLHQTDTAHTSIHNITKISSIDCHHFSSMNIFGLLCMGIPCTEILK